MIRYTAATALIEIWLRDAQAQAKSDQMQRATEHLSKTTRPAADIVARDKARKRIIFKAFERAARNQEPAPSNAALRLLCQAGSDCAISLLVTELERENKIEVIRSGNARTVIIVATGRRTKATKSIGPYHRPRSRPVNMRHA